MPIAKVAENWQPNSKNLKHYKGLQKSVVIKSATIRGNWLEPPAMSFDFDPKLARLPKNRNEKIRVATNIVQENWKIIQKFTQLVL